MTAMTTFPKAERLTVAAAQTLVCPGDVQANVRQHLQFVEAAAAEGVQLLVFPELSLLGYEPDALSGHVLAPDAPQLVPLRDAAARHGMVLVVGAAVPADAGQDLPGIGALVLHPDGRTEVYRKHFLHAGEAQFASAGAAPAHVLNVASQPVGLAVCADITHAAHALAARSAGAAIYACSMVLSANGYPAESAMLQGYARTHGMAVLMANFGAATGGFECVGRSALWAAGGEMVVAAPGGGACLVVGRWSAAPQGCGTWTGAVVPIAEVTP
jgi:predicted amidohydrolase